MTWPSSGNWLSDLIVSPLARKLVLVLAIVLLAAVLRGLAVARLPVDFDEPVYTEAGLVYAAAIRAGDLSLLRLDPAPEHPGLVKLVYGGVFLLSPSLWEGTGDPLPNPLPGGEGTGDPLPNPLPGGEGTRGTSAVVGVVHVLLLALVSPVAGALLAVHSYTVKYTVQVYLEALPMFTATLCVLSYMMARKSSRKGRQGGKERQEDSSWRSLPPWRPLREPFFWTLSAVALGLTAAGKYIYAVAGLAVAADYLWRLAAERRPRGLLVLLGWGGLAVLAFFAANPALWPDPFGGLLDSLAFHTAYSQSAHVQQSGYPWYQPFVWLVAPMPVMWHPGIIVTPLDPLIALLGVVGLRPMARAWDGRGRVIVLWWGIGLLFALLWPTKWPQYSLIMTAPMCLCAAAGLRSVVQRLKELTQRTPRGQRTPS